MIRFYTDSSNTIVRIDSSNTIVVAVNSRTVGNNNSSCSCRVDTNDAAEQRRQINLNTDEHLTDLPLCIFRSYTISVRIKTKLPTASHLCIIFKK